MRFSTSVLATALWATATSAANLTFYTDISCQTLHSVVQWNDTLVCHQTTSSSTPSTQPMGVVFHLSDFESAYLTGQVFTSTDCTSACSAGGGGIQGGSNLSDFVVEVENESPNSAYPIANGQCIQAQPFNATYGSYRFGSFR